MNGVLGIIIFFVVWFGIAQSGKKQGFGFLRRNFFGFCGSFLVTCIFFVAVAPKTQNIDSAKNTQNVSAVESKGAIANSNEPVQAAPEEQKESIPSSAQELYAAYDENEVAADNKYKGNRILLSGTIQSIDKDYSDAIVIRLATGNQFMPVNVTLQNKFEAMAASLKKGQLVTFDCIGNGRIIGSPVVKNCAPI